MRVLSAAGLTPISLHKTTAEPKRLFPFKYRKVLTQNIAAISSALYANGLAKALTYEEALNQSVGNPASFQSSSDFDFGQFLDGLVQFGSENPLVIGGGAAVLVVPLILSQVLKQPSKPWGVETAKIAFSKLAEDIGAQLVDIREPKDLKEVGKPDVRGLKKKAVAITYKREDKPGFLRKLALRFKEPESTTLFILDKFDGNSELVSELATVNGFKAAYAIKDGAEGPRGWLNSGLPWSEPKKGIGIDFGDLKDAITSALGFEENADGLPVTLGLAAATGLGVIAFTEIETVLQLLGSAALIQFVTKKLLFAEDRKATLQQADEFLSTKIAPKDFVDEIKMIGKALLPIPTSVKSLPAPVQETSETAASTSTKTVLKDETSLAPVANSVPKAEASEGSLPGLSRPQSPFPYYPDLKPPSSPAPKAPVQEKSETPASTSPVLKADSVSETKPELKEQTSPAPVVNSIPKAEVSEESLPGLSRPLSPFPYYPDLKPPSSPSPAQP